MCFFAHMSVFIEPLRQQGIIYHYPLNLFIYFYIKHRILWPGNCLASDFYVLVLSCCPLRPTLHFLVLCGIILFLSRSCFQHRLPNSGEIYLSTSKHSGATQMSQYCHFPKPYCYLGLSDLSNHRSLVLLTEDAL